MTWFEEDGKAMAETTLKLLKENDGYITKYQVWDIIDSNQSYGFRKTMSFASKYLKEYGIERTENGGMRFTKGENND